MLMLKISAIRKNHLAVVKTDFTILKNGKRDNAYEKKNFFCIIILRLLRHYFWFHERPCLLDWKQLLRVVLWSRCFQKKLGKYRDAVCYQESVRLKICNVTKRSTPPKVFFKGCTIILNNLSLYLKI